MRTRNVHIILAVSFTFQKTLRRAWGESRYIWAKKMICTSRYKHALLSFILSFAVSAVMKRGISTVAKKPLLGRFHATWPSMNSDSQKSVCALFLLNFEAWCVIPEILNRMSKGRLGDCIILFWNHNVFAPLFRGNIFSTSVLPWSMFAKELIVLL